MLEFLAQLVILAVVGLVIGVGVVITKESPKVSAFFSNRPVLAFPLAAVLGGIVAYAILYGLWVLTLTVVALALK